MASFKRWKSIALDFIRPADKLRAQIYIKRIAFKDGTTVDVPKDAIFILTGPNNVGKSTALREIRDYLLNNRRPYWVVRDIETSKEGSRRDFEELVINQGIYDPDTESFKNGYSEYRIAKMEEDYERNFVGSYPMTFFVTHLGAQQRLANTEPARRKDYRRDSPDHPVLWMELDEAHQDRIVSVFEKSFGLSLVLNVMRGEVVELHVVPIDEAKSIPNNTKKYIQWINSFPTLQNQGDGLRSFAGALLSLLIHPRNVTLMDEPEAFLHPPQAKRLAEVIALESNKNSQIYLATHNDEIIKALLDSANDRVIIARLSRSAKGSSVRLLDHRQISKLWTDPLLRTSNVLSALFHIVAVFFEGESDARFFRAMMDATRQDRRDVDCQFYHVGGKDRIASIAAALKSLDVPVVAVVDIDILSDKTSFLRLFEALGGRKSQIEADLQIIQRSMAAKGRLNYVDFLEKVKVALQRVEVEQTVSNDVIKDIHSALRATSSWQSIKEVGMVGFNSDAFAAFQRILPECKNVGLLINQEGELEGFCREISRLRKAAWLVKVLEKNLSSDESLSKAREFTEVLREMLLHNAGD